MVWDDVFNGHADWSCLQKRGTDGDIIEASYISFVEGVFRTGGTVPAPSIGQRCTRYTSSESGIYKEVFTYDARHQVGEAPSLRRRDVESSWVECTIGVGSA